MNNLSLVTRFRSMSWRWKAAIFAATTVFVMVVLASNSEPLTPYEQAFVGVWLDAHPNGSATRLRLDRDRVAYRGSERKVERIGRWSADKNESVLKVQMDETLLESFSLDFRLRCLRSGDLKTAISGFPAHTSHYTIEQKASEPIALKWPHYPNASIRGSSMDAHIDAPIYCRSVRQAGQFDREHARECKERMARLEEWINEFLSE